MIIQLGDKKMRLIKITEKQNTEAFYFTQKLLSKYIYMIYKNEFKNIKSIIKPTSINYNSLIYCNKKFYGSCQYLSFKSFKENINNKYFIINGLEIKVGFLSIELNEIDICSNKPIHISINNLHISDKFQKHGIGKEVIELLLKKQVPLEMLVYKFNKNMHKLIRKFKHTEDTWTSHLNKIIIYPKYQ